MENLHKESKIFSSENNIDEIKRKLLDPRYISKNLDLENDFVKSLRPKDRGETASDILNQREKLRQIKTNIKAEEEKLINSNLELNKLIQSLNEVNKNLDDLRANIILKIINLFLGGEILKRKLIEKEFFSQEADNIKQKIKEIEQKIKNLYCQQQEMPKPQEILDSYYERISHLPLTQAEKRNFLKPEILCQLSLDEYIALWRRLNPYFLSHVTRQGCRDHFSMFYHSSGIGEFHNGFKDILKDNKMLRPPSVMKWGLLRDRESIKNFLDEKILPSSKNIDEAKEKLHIELNFSLANAPLYPDKIALHFACQDVLDAYYGGEEGNEIFVIFPVDCIASQFHFAFNSWLVNDFTKAEKDRAFNDVFVWTGNLDNPGISIDAGIVFIPADALVDPETGSKYASKIENGKTVLVEDKFLIEKFVEWLNNINEESDFVKLYKAYFGDYRKFSEFLNYLLEQMKNLGFDNDMAARLGNEIYQEISLVLNPEKLNTYYNYEQSFNRKKAIQVIANEILTKTMAKFKKAENPITSEEYWRRYFETYPDLKPKHLVFYKGSPTSAVLRFLLENNIGQADSSQSEGVLLGFGDHHIKDINDKESLAWQGYSEIVDTAEQIIDEYYRNKGRNV